MTKLAILHLSDLHLRSSRNHIVTRVNDIVNALNAHSHEVEHALLTISGDIAYSGDTAEYGVAIDFIRQLSAKIAENGIQLSPDYVIVPGNHDCSFVEPNSIRDMFLSNTSRNRDHLGADMITACLKVQSNYRQFLQTIQPAAEHDSSELFASRIIIVGDKKILVNTGNTAWVSRIHEQQGQIFIPADHIQAKADTETDVCISVFHHPYNWFESTNAREFRSRIEEISDLIFTGHEHEPGAFRRQTPDSEYNDYIEGHVLQDSSEKNNSGFNIIILDLAERSFQSCIYQWKGEYYGMSGAPHLRQFANHSRKIIGAFDPSSKFREFLDDPGAHYSHPRVGYVTLEQVFVMPDFREVSETDSPKLTHNSTVQGKDAFSIIGSRERILITGAEKSGRTCVGKRICLRLIKDARVPVFISTSKDQKLVTEANFERLLTRVFAEQYSPTLFERFNQLPRDRRAIVLDDFHLAPLNRKGKATFIKRLTAQFGKVVILGDESLRLEDISSRNRDGALFDSFVEFQILEFGRVLRDRVIQKWITLGQEAEISEADVDSKQKAFSHAVDTVLGKNLVPSYPIFVLVILQQLEASSHHQTSNGSYGYFYEYLITQSLTSKTPAEVDLKYNYLAEFAWMLHKQDRRSVTELEYNQFALEYSREYKITINGANLLKELSSAGVLATNSLAEIHFKYKYNNYYFIARWLAQNIANQEARDHVKKLAEGIHREEYANVIIFLSYLSKDPIVVDVVLEASKELYPDISPCDMSAHTRYLNDLQERIPELICDELDGSKSREVALQRMDEADGKRQQAEEQQTAELLKINRAFKTVDVLGQILKNYAGSMRGDMKMRVARECVAVALRSMNFFLNLLENNLQGFVDYLVEYYVKQEKIEDREEIVKKAKQLIFFLANTWATGVIKRVSRAAGSQQLEQIYRELDAEFGSVSMHLVELSVKLDHFTNFPKTLVEEVHASIHDNFFADSVLRRLVVSHFYLFPVEHSIRESICAKLDIKIEKGLALDARSKKTSEYS